MKLICILALIFLFYSCNKPGYKHKSVKENLSKSNLDNKSQENDTSIILPIITVEDNPEEPFNSIEHQKKLNRIITKYPADKLIKLYKNRKAQFKIFEKKNSIDKYTYSGTINIDKPEIYKKWLKENNYLQLLEYKIIAKYEKIKNRN